MEYKGVETEDGKQVEFDGEAIPEVAYTETSQSDLEWGYSGAGPTNTARSILEHAQSQGICQSVSPEAAQVDFRKEFIQSLTDAGWTISLDEIKDWCQNRP